MEFFRNSLERPNWNMLVINDLKLLPYSEELLRERMSNPESMAIENYFKYCIFGEKLKKYMTIVKSIKC